MDFISDDVPVYSYKLFKFYSNWDNYFRVSRIIINDNKYMSLEVPRLDMASKTTSVTDI